MNDRRQKFGLLCKGKREDNIAPTLTAAIWFAVDTIFLKIYKVILFFVKKIIFYIYF